LKSQII